jgi:signal transduction histidine kinase
LKKHFTYFILLFCTVQSYAQQALVFESITTANGLPSNYIFCVTEDSDGFMWVGTDKGLCRYNGASWEVWDIDNGLPGNYINKLFSDKQNGLWLGLAEKGAFHFNCNTKKITKILASSIDVQHLTTTDDGDLQILTKDKNSFTTWLCKPNSLNEPVKVEETPTLLTTYSHNDTIAKITHSFLLSYNESPPELKPLFNNSIIHDWRKIKVPNTEYGMEEVSGFMLNYNFVYRYYDNPKKDTLLLLKSLELSNKFTPYLDTKEILYVAKPGIALYAIQKSNNSITEYTTDNGLTNLVINSIYKSKDGSLYISTLGGGIHVLPQNEKRYFTLTHSPIRNLQMSNGFYYGMADGTLYKFNNNEIIKETFIRKDALSFYINNDSLMVGSFDGFHYYAYKNTNATLQKTFRITAGISSIIPRGNQWLFSTHGTGFGITKDFVTSDIIHDNLPFSNIEKTVRLKNGYGALSYEDGFFICDNDLKPLHHFNIKNGLISNYVSVLHNQNDTLWVGCKNGLSLIIEGKVSKNFSGREGFKGKIVKAIFTSNKNELWVVSDTHLHMYSQGQLKTVSSTSKNDLIANCFYDKYSDNLILGTEKRLSILKLASITTNKTTAPPMLSQVIIDNKNYPKTEKLELSYNTTDLVFRFKPIGNLLFSRTDLYYRLNEGDWAKVSDSLVLSLNKLRTGDYKLIAKTINTDGFESEPVIVYSFRINRPWWQQWWFVLLYSLALLSIVYAIIQYVNKNKQRQLLQKLQVQQELEAERQRISRDLHDNMGSYTSALIANVQQLKNRTGETEDVQKMQSNAEQILSSLRETIWVLNNKEISVQEFSDGFKNYCFKVLKNFDKISFDGTEKIENNRLLTASQAIQLNKIMQEAVQNIIKHSTATQINYSVSSDQQMTIRISDNGKGFDTLTNKNGNGLENMRWRATEAGFNLIINSRPLQGTTVTLNTL